MLYDEISVAIELYKLHIYELILFMWRVPLMSAPVVVTISILRS